MAVAFVAIASAVISGPLGSGSLTRASGFTLYEYVYSVKFNQPARAFTFAFKSSEKITNVTASPGFSRCVVNDALGFFRCLGHAAANTVISGSFYLKHPLSPGVGASLYWSFNIGPFPITGP